MSTDMNTNERLTRCYHQALVCLYDPADAGRAAAEFYAAAEQAGLDLAETRHLSAPAERLRHTWAALRARKIVTIG